MPFEVFAAPASSILSATAGFIAEAGFTHSLTPARNCTFGCSYCYVPTMRVYGGLKPEDWRHWGQFTTFKSNAPQLLRRALRENQVIYCSPLVDPYQAAEESEQIMPRILDELLQHPPKIFVIQTRGPLIVRDLEKLIELSRRTTLRVSFSITTNREPVRKLYEPHCATINCRLTAIRQLRAAGITTFATLAPILPCDPEELAGMALEASDQDIIADPLHVRSVKPRGATTREAAFAICQKHGFSEWLDSGFQREAIERIASVVESAGRRCAARDGRIWMAGTITAHSVLERLGIRSDESSHSIASLNPADGSELARVRLASAEDYERTVAQSIDTFQRWRMFPAPKRGQIVREIGDELRLHKDDLGLLVTLETGKILAEGKGEVQEMIDIADFAVGLSRQLYGLTIASERPEHRMLEQWQPLGIVGIISAFNFPVAVWSWNALLAAVCGDCMIWKPSLKTPLTAIAVQNICDRVLDRHGWRGVFQPIVGEDAIIGKRLIEDRHIPLISATGSTRMGRIVAETVARRLGRTLLELGGNNAVIVMNDANLDLALRAVLFGAVGTAGQRCTSIRRLFLHRGIAQEMTCKLQAAYAHIRIGDPSEEKTLMGPLIDRQAVETMRAALARIQAEGGEIIYGGDDLGGCYVKPALVKARADMPIIQEEVFAPILYLIEFDSLDQAILAHNAVPQGLSSAMFTTNLISAETFLSARGSDCGIANINIGTSGAEIGGAFGGEKDTGGGRESGSDAWKAYMRRQTVTINWSQDLPLAQGIEFDV